MNKRRGLKIFLLLSSLTLLTGCDNLGQEIGDTIKENLFTNIWATLAQIVATVVLLILIIVFAYKPAKKFLNKRRELLDNEVSETKRKNDEADTRINEANDNIKKSKVKAQEILETAEEDAIKVKNDIISGAEEESKRIIENAQEVIKQQKEQALSDIKDVVVTVALDASSKILEREVTEQDNQNIIDNFVKEVKEDNKGN